MRRTHAGTPGFARAGLWLAAALMAAVPTARAQDPAAPSEERVVADAKPAAGAPDTSPATPATPAPVPAAPTPAPTAAPEAVVEPATGAGPSPIEVTGFVDTYWGTNFNDPPGDTMLRNFDNKHGQISLNVIEVALEQKPSAQNRLGFRADLNFGPVTDMVHAFEPGGADVFKAFEQAYVSVLAPAGQGLQIDVGKFVTPMGAEVIEAKDNWNYSRSLLFALAIPYYHVGLRASLPVGDKLTLAGFAVNGWNNGVDNNGGKTFAVQAVVKPTARFSIVQAVMTGAEQTDDDDSRRFLSDTTLTFNVTDSLALMANYDYGKDTVAGTRVTWQGLAGYLRYQVTPSFAFSPRFEWARDRDGFMTGTAQDLKELTLTTEMKFSGALLTRLEYRRDMSNQLFYPTDTGFSKSQSTLVIGMVYAFGAKL